MTDGSFLRGIFNIVPTPFAASGDLDEDGMGRLIDFVVGTGVSGMIVAVVRPGGVDRRHSIR